MSNDMFDHMMHDSPESPADSATIAGAIRREKGQTMPNPTPHLKLCRIDDYGWCAEHERQAKKCNLGQPKTTPQPTPGPWTAHHDPDRGTFTVVDANGFGVAMHILEEANAHLIANAPRVAQEHAEMVEVLKAALPLLERAAIEEARSNKAPTGLPLTNARRERYEQARALLARIEGK